MTPRYWVILSAVAFVVMFRCAWNSIPEPRTLTEAPTPTRVSLTVLPTVFASPSPEPPVVLDALPMVTSTRVPPSLTPTVAPATATPTPNTTQKPVQRG